MTFKDRFRKVVAMWIFVGLLGGPFFMAMGAAVIVGVGPYAPHRYVSVAGELPVGTETKIQGKDGAADLPPGDFMVLATPTTVDPDDVTCEWKSRVFTTGEQRSGALEPSRVEGYTDVVTDPDTDVEYRTVVTTARGTGWMEPDFLTCTGTGVETFALAADGGMADSTRPFLGAGGVAFGVLATALGFGALQLTRRWRREDAAASSAGRWSQRTEG